MMITLELSSENGILYKTYFKQDYDLELMLSRIITVATFGQEPGNFLLTATYKDGKQTKYYTNRPTEGMHRILSNYKKLFNLAYKMAKEKVWPGAWLLGNENYHITCALLQMDQAREIHTMEAWGGEK